ncbi:hypothetical protein [Apilactobacillus kunkeei]|uniref:hypothetical protein n=1 Tax=Apilactobacillus kunkeei TaxID=148814 RepID=UPI0006C5E630|nr:hypothetical protein [Apilactobacillus kunkeei]KOY72151.1 hypothetical protein RZ55_06670 [Apilactobacillus kunkeei]
MENIDVILHGKKLIFEKDDWREYGGKNRDYNRQISYKCKLLDESQDKTTAIGMIKVWCHSDLRKEIDKLENKDDFAKANADPKRTYYTMGSDTYYDNLRSFFGDDYKEILRYFNDLSFLISELRDNISYKIIKHKKPLIKNFFEESQKEAPSNDDSDEFELSKCLKPKGKISYKMLKSEGLDDLKALKKLEELKKIKDIKETSYLSKHIYVTEDKSKEEIDYALSEMHRKENVTYLFSQSKNYENKKRMDSKKGLYRINADRSSDILKNFFDLFTKAETPSIRRVGDIGKQLYYPCDMPEQVMFINDDKKINEKIKTAYDDKPSKENEIVYDDEYDYRRKNLLYKIKLNRDVELEDEFNNLREFDKEILTDSFRKVFDYRIYKRCLCKLIEVDTKQIKNCSLDKDEMLMILKICSFISRNMFLIILKDISEDTLRIIENIAKLKNFIILYVKNDSEKQCDDALSEYLNNEKGE